MALTTRRQFVQQTAFAAAAFCGSPLAGTRRMFEAREQNAAPLDATAIRKLVSQISGHVITPETPDYESSRQVFNRAFDRHPVVIVTLVRDLDEATQHFGLATTSGGCPTVGIAGLTLGGGEGRLMEKYGTACDNLLSAQVVTVDGRQIEASHSSNPDLFWAIRGGGGNFGVVTALEHQLHPVGQVVSGALMYPAGRIADLLEAFVKFLAGAPDEMDAFAQLLPSEQGRRLKIDLCYCGDPRMGNDLVRPLRALKPEDDSVKAMSYLEAQAAGGFLLKPVAHFQTNLILRELSGPAIAAITTAINNAPATCKLIIVPLRGAVSRVSVSHMAYALRQPGYEIDMAGVWNTPEQKAEVVRWVNSARDTLQPFAHGVYVNQLGDTSDQLVRSGYGSNYARLVEIKKKYDPTNVLRLNQNIKPDSPPNS
jgi:Berberine and berberine like/FAD binding domain